MRNFLAFLCVAIIFYSCKTKSKESSSINRGDSSQTDKSNNPIRNFSEFKLSAHLEHSSSDYAILNKINIHDGSMTTIDTLKIENNSFSKIYNFNEEEFFELNFPGGEYPIYFINDESQLDLQIDFSDKSKSQTPGNTALNKELYENIRFVDNFLNEQKEQEQKAKRLMANNDMVGVIQLNKNWEQKIADYQKNLLNVIATSKSPNICMFALTNAQLSEMQRISEQITEIQSRFPNHSGVKALANMIANQQNQPEEQTETTSITTPVVGSVAKDFTINDVDGRPVSLTSFRGKYVLVDFWASWCGPCRGENPNVVAAFQKYNQKNFTVLGVSLDKNKEQWLQAIQDDNLTWTHVCEFGGWQGKVALAYGVESIPFNLLLDPTGKIIATNLRGDQLDKTLQKVLK